MDNMRFSKFLLFAFLVVILTGSAVCQGSEDPKDMVDFIVLVDRSPPDLPDWVPPRALQKRPPTDRIHKWVQRLVEQLLESAQTRGVDARVAVFVLSRNSHAIWEVAEFYSRSHRTPNNYSAILQRLKSAFEQLHTFNGDEFVAITQKVLNAIDASKPENRMGVPDIVIWVVPYDKDDMSTIKTWRLMHDHAIEILVGMSGYVEISKDARAATILTISDVLNADTYKVTALMNMPQTAPLKLIGDAWTIFKSCRSNVTSTRCHYNQNGDCVVKKSYTPHSPDPALLKYCRKGSAEVDCQRDYCDDLCEEDSEEGPCSVTCGTGTAKWRPRIETELNQYCPPLPCTRKPCPRPTDTSPMTWLPSESGTPSTTTTVFVLEPWKIVLIAASATTVLATIIGLIICFVHMRKQRRRQLQNASGHSFARSDDRRGRRRWRYPWSRRVQSPSRPRTDYSRPSRTVNRPENVSVTKGPGQSSVHIYKN